jgi:hypothetical protein
LILFAIPDLEMASKSAQSDHYALLLAISKSGMASGVLE